MKSRVVAKLLAGAAIAAAVVVGSTAPTTASAHDVGWFSVTSGQVVSAGHAVNQPASDVGWF